MMISKAKVCFNVVDISNTECVIMELPQVFSISHYMSGYVGKKLVLYTRMCYLES